MKMRLAFVISTSMLASGAQASGLLGLNLAGSANGGASLSTLTSNIFSVAASSSSSTSLVSRFGHLAGGVSGAGGSGMVAGLAGGGTGRALLPGLPDINLNSASQFSGGFQSSVGRRLSVALDGAAASALDFSASRGGFVSSATNSLQGSSGLSLSGLRQLTAVTGFAGSSSVVATLQKASAMAAPITASQ